MVKLLGDNKAFGWPGLEPRWTRGDKDGIGTPYAASSRIWFTLREGIVTEVYYPTVDRPQLRDLQYLVTDGASFFHDETRDFETTTERLSHHVLGYRVTERNRERDYSIVKEIITDPHLPCLLQRTRVEGDPKTLRQLRLYALCAPRLGGAGWGNNAHVAEVSGRTLLVAEHDGVWLALGATVPFRRVSCGYVGSSDGWTDLSENFQMDWEFDHAGDGHVALTGEVDVNEEREFTLGLALGDSLHAAVTSLLQCLAIPFEAHKARYIEQWERACARIGPLEKATGDNGDLYHGSYSLLMAHEDKTYPGALIASLSIPWGEARGDDDQGGYHLVWTRDMVNSASGLLAAGNTETPFRALQYLIASQLPDGGFPQNFWIDGTPYWQGIQLDEVAFPIMLAWRLKKEGLVGASDIRHFVMRAAAYLVRNGPATQQERWEEASGYSPSTLASNVAALVCAASIARETGESPAAQFLEEYADFLERHIEAWTVTSSGTLVPGIARHFIRIHPVAVNDFRPDEDPNHGLLGVANRPPGAQWQFPAKDVVDAGFLELVRYGVRRAEDRLIEDSLAVVDAVLKVDTPYGPAWRRYNHDGYGQRDDGSPFHGWGRGRAWPLLTGERGHYELAAGRSARPYIEALERFASTTGLLPEQVWDAPDRPDVSLHNGRPTGSAMPLMWAHAEYIKLLRSALDGQPFDRIPEVAARYVDAGGGERRPLEVWKPNRQPQAVARGAVLRVQAPSGFRLRWTRDEWATQEDTPSTPTGLGIEFVDIPVPHEQRAPVRFTFFWTATARWEEQDYQVAARDDVP